MSRATSGLVICSESSLIRFSKVAISASIVPGSRAFLITLTRFDPSEAEKESWFRSRRALLADLVFRSDVTLPDGRVSETACVDAASEPSNLEEDPDRAAFQS